MIAYPTNCPNISYNSVVLIIIVAFNNTIMRND